jgi:hypothetical protein
VILARFQDAGNASPSEVVPLFASHGIPHANKGDQTIDAVLLDPVSASRRPWHQARR